MSGHPPCPLMALMADLIARVHVRALVAIHFYGHKIFIDDFRDFRDSRSSRGRSRGTSGTTPRRCPAAAVCLRSSRVRNAPSPHSYQSIGWCAAERRYGLAESFSRFSLICAQLPFRREEMTAAFLQNRRNAKWSVTGLCRRAPGRADPAAFCRRSLRPAGGNSGCGLRPASSRDRLLRCSRWRENRAARCPDP